MKNRDENATPCARGDRLEQRTAVPSALRPLLVHRILASRRGDPLPARDRGDFHRLATASAIRSFLEKLVWVRSLLITRQLVVRLIVGEVGVRQAHFDDMPVSAKVESRKIAGSGRRSNAQSFPGQSGARKHPAVKCEREATFAGAR